MVRVLITGMSGAGKSTLLGRLARRGHRTIDTDYDGWELADGTWDEPRMDALLADGFPVVVSGTAENQGRFYNRFEYVVLLSAPVGLLLERVRARTNNPYGRSAHDQEEIRRYVIEVQPLLRSGADLELDGRRPVDDLADEIESLLKSGTAAPSV
ncbi:AAA family ATPase [Microbacterium cremeum]|uniref:AAA family ATPase n=1 Tax=Microbacterium cremeum TaxID=2782169 RepID=UPI001887F0AA|nr:AAA family ATPase [Microbacterium cremeum]